MNRVAKTFADLFPNIFPQPNDEARRSHPHDLPVVWHPIEGGMEQQPTLAEHRLDVERHLDVGCVQALVWRMTASNSNGSDMGLQ